MKKANETRGQDESMILNANWKVWPHHSSKKGKEEEDDDDSVLKYELLIKVYMFF